LKKIIIAIDGYSSCGKSTLAKALSKELDYAYVDTGAMYRAVTLYFLENNINWVKKEDVEKALAQIIIHFERVEGVNTTFLNGENVEEKIRTLYVANHVSDVAAISEVRRSMVRLQQLMGEQKAVVMDGRDIGTVVFPSAELKIFMTAKPEIRIQRRLDELTEKGQSVDYEEIRHNLSERDRIDTTRADSPLTKANDAIILDNSDINQEEQMAVVMQWINEKIKK
jgi:CMP/dCMP kinase